MFTGLIQTTGRLSGRKISGAAGKLSVETDSLFTDLKHGESIAVNGACLTLESHSGLTLVFHVLEETFSRTNLGSLPPGSVLNLERAMAAGERFGGHIVTGHIDGCGRVLSLGETDSDMEIRVSIPDAVRGFLVPKGSIAVDGISLTVADLADDSFAVRIIPTTWNETALRFRVPGTFVDLEADLIGKYVRFQLETMLGKTHNSSAHGEITMNDLLEAGF